jgi:hypothetical protein
MTEGDYYSVSQAAKVLKVTPGRIRQMQRRRMLDDLKWRRVELLWELYKRRKDGRLQLAAMALEREAGGPEYDWDKTALIEDGAIEQANVPVYGQLGPPELYMVTPKGEQILREWGYL